MAKPCYDCKDRKLSCHSNCVKYHRYKTRLDKISQSKLQEVEYENYLYESIKRMKGASI